MVKENIMDIDKLLTGLSEVPGDRPLAHLGDTVSQQAQTIALQAAKIERLEGFIRMLAEKHPEILPKEEGETNDKGTK
jgi:hypothetical protein